MRIIVRLFIVSLLAAATSLQAITYIVPNDRDLVKRAEAIVIATAVESHSELRDDGRLVTVATLRVERTLKGSVADSVQLVELGGAVDGRMTFIPGSPRYENGQRYLVFLRTNPLGEWMTFGFGLGKFEFVSDLRGRELLTRGGVEDEIFGFDESDGSAHVERLRDATEFLSFVTNRIVAEGPVSETYFVNRSDVVFATFPEFRPHASAFIPRVESTRPDYLLAGNFRWQAPSASFFHCCNAQTGGTGLDGPSASSAAMSAWNSVSGAGISYSLTGLDPASPTVPHGLDGTPDSKNDIVFNDRHGLIGNSGAAAVGGISNTNGSYSGLGDGFTYNRTSEVDVETGNNLPSFVDQSLFTQLLTHELGHTLGFRHADQTADGSAACQSPSPCAAVGVAIMASVIPKPNSIGSLGQWDLDAAQTVYGSGPVCNAPQVTTQPLASQSIASGSQANLSVVASGTATLTYQWYVGTSGNTSSPVGGATSATFHPTPPIGTTNYWVRVSNSCSGVHTADSNTAAVTVTCTAPSAPAPNANPTSIASGQSSTITVTPTGTAPFTYQWYTGNSGVTSNPISGETNSSVTVRPVVTTSYWVRVTGPCAPPADSPATSVTVTPCVPPTASTPNPSPASIPNGQSSTIFENPSGTGPFTYQWYVGTSGVTTTPIGGATNSFVTVSPAVTTSYWVRVTGQCAPPSDSPTATVTVTCSPISSQGVTAQPSTINAGQSSTLFFSTSGAGPFTIQWYRGSQGDTSNPINGATSTSTVVSPTVTTSYWVRVSSGACGTQDGSAIVVVNGSVCTAPSITTQPISTSTNSGSPVTLTVVAAGTPTLTYQWYIGEKGDVTNKINGATLSSLTQSPTVTTKYWVRVTNTCGGTQNADSNAATVTVTVICANPTITTQPASVSAPIGTAATLHVVAGGAAPLHYQWFEGVKGDTSKPRGTDSATFVTGAVSVTTSYWVHVTNSCGGSPGDSNAATVTATAPPRGRAARH